MKLPYNKNDPFSIEKYAKILLNKSIKDVIGQKAVQERIGKGKFGQLIEELYFQYSPNSISQPDFPEAGVELKTSPLKKLGNSFVSKERLVFNIIDYNTEYKKSFANSSFWKKNSLLLLMFYLYERENIDIDYIFKIIRLWRFPVKDLKIIKEDWEKIVQKIKDGKAHELSEGDTFYLGACTKGANKESTRKQPFSSIPAKQRAFSLKSKYLNFIIQKSLYEKEELIDISEYKSILEEPEVQVAAESETEYSKKFLFDIEPIVKTLNDYRNNESFEELVIRKFIPFYNNTEKQLIKKLNINIETAAKNKFEVISRGILGIKKKKIEEFEKADVQMKTIRIESNNSIKESMSFRQIQFKEIIYEDWEDSEWYQELSRRLFFVIFKADNNNEYRLMKAFFWSIPQNDMDLLQTVWIDTKRKIKKGDFEHFIKSSDNRIGHVRPKARDSEDLMEAPDGTMQKKKCFWLNSAYIKSVIEKEIRLR
ncbi:MAG: DNA mismatch repair protein [Bacteroidetes bacterium]|nr:DNA mismatch repair protein [Bacteroidota bacterium]